MKGTKRMISMLVIVAVLAGSMAGCGKKETAVTDNKEVTGQETDGGEDLATGNSDNALLLLCCQRQQSLFYHRLPCFPLERLL